MPARYFTCPDGGRIEIVECLKEGGCRMPNRCATRSYLKMVSSERVWTGVPSTTMLIGGTMLAFLRLTKEYAISPDDRAFMIHGTKGHARLEGFEDEFSLAEGKLEDPERGVTGIFDVVETEDGKSILVDYKTSGSFKVAKALGFWVDTEETGEVYKSGKRKGEARTRKILKRDDAHVDRWEWTLQLNNYRMMLEAKGHRVDEIRIMCVVRDGNTYIARSRGVFRNVYYFKIPFLNDKIVVEYFRAKRRDLLLALKQGYWKYPCSEQESWGGIRCKSYCEVAEHCLLGKFLKQERKELDVPIKGLSEARRFPRDGKIALGIKVISEKSKKEYPKEVDYFVLKPGTPSELQNQKMLDQFHALYGEQPKSIAIMFPVGDPEVVFPQSLKRYGRNLLQCKGDGVTAQCISEKHAEGLEILGEEDGRILVKCLKEECPYYQSKKCKEIGILQVLLPELPGIGVWQITTSSIHSIININSGLDYLIATCGRFHMLPLILERRPRESQREENGKIKKSTHYMLHLNTDMKLVDMQRWAGIEPTKVLLGLPEVSEDVEDILLEQTSEEAIYDALPDKSIPEVETGKAEKESAENGKPETGSTFEVWTGGLAQKMGVDQSLLEEFILETSKTKAQAMLRAKKAAGDKEQKAKLKDAFQEWAMEKAGAEAGEPTDADLPGINDKKEGR